MLTSLSIYIASFHAETQSCCSQQADTAANYMSVVSTFTPATFSPVGIHKSHAAQPDLLLLLLCDLSSPLCGRTEITEWLLMVMGLVPLLQLQPFNGLFSKTTWARRYQKGKTNLDFTGARDSEWQWHQLGHMQVCTSLQTDNHISTPPLCFLQAGCPSCRPTNSVKALKAY